MPISAPPSSTIAVDRSDSPGEVERIRYEKKVQMPGSAQDAVGIMLRW